MSRGGTSFVMWHDDQRSCWIHLHILDYGLTHMLQNQGGRRRAPTSFICFRLAKWRNSPVAKDHSHNCLQCCFTRKLTAPDSLPEVHYTGIIAPENLHVLATSTHLQAMNSRALSVQARDYKA